MHLRPGSQTLLVALVTVAAASCAPNLSGRPAPSFDPEEPAPAERGREARTAIIALNAEPAGVAPLNPGASGFGANFAVRPFNAFLELMDDRGDAHPYLAQSLPQLNTDTWRVFPDGRMETRYRLKPNLTWHDGARLAAEDFVFAWRVYTTREVGVPQGAAHRSRSWMKCWRRTT